MVLKNGQVKSEHSSNSTPSSSSSSPTSGPTSSKSSEYTLFPRKGDLLVVRQMLGHVHKDVGETQKENIFHTRCLINNKVCIHITYGESCTDITSKRLVKKLELSTIPHLKPYKLQWLSEDGEIKVSNQGFSISKYKNEVLCDVVPIEASHVVSTKAKHVI